MASTDDARISVTDTSSRDRMPRRWVTAGIVLALAVALTLYLVKRDHAATWPVPHADASVAGLPVTVGADVCGRGWTGGKAGRANFALWNDSIGGMEVYLRDVATQKVYLDVENLGSGATRSASVRLGAGRYQFHCLPDDNSPVDGAAQTVTGSAGAATPGLVPISSAQLIPPTQHYTAWITHRLPVLQHQVARLASDVRSGDLGAARSDWLSGHRTYETLGAAYDAFGEYDADINGDTSGFHLVERQLWGSGSPAAEKASTVALVHAVARLRSAFPSLADQMGTQTIGLRSHEILENAIQFELNGTTDAGSHTELATIDANLTGTLAALKPLRSLLKDRDPDLATTDAWIARSQRLVRSYHRDGRWTPLTALSRPQREQLDADLEQTAEYLSQIAVITEPRRTDQ